jgi:hypothetical protein
MTLRRSRKQSMVKRLAQLWVGTRVARAAKNAVKLWAGSKTAKTAGKAATSGGKRGRLVAGALGIAAIAAVIRKRKRSAREAEVDYGPPNESVPSHETLAPSQEAAGHTA